MKIFYAFLWKRKLPFVSRKFFLVMKLSAVFLVVASLAVSARGFSQNIDYSGKDVPLSEVFSILHQQTGYVFFYNDADINGKATVTVTFRHTPLKEALNEILIAQKLNYTIQGKTIFIQSDPEIEATSLNGAAKPVAVKIHGRVTDRNGNPLVGVTISVKGAPIGTTSDANGYYSLSLADSSVTLVYSYIGYKREEIRINGRAQIDAVLSTNVSGLDQVVVIGYGTTEKKDLTGAISSVDVEALQNQNPTSLQDVLRSNVAGLNVGFSTAAMPGGALQIRGTNSLTAGTSPLIVVDGAIYYGALSDINPQDIVRVDVLKGASAAAVYGAKAASGVISITTKRGHKGKPTINFNANYALATMEVNQPVYQGKAFVKYRTDVENSFHGFNEKPYQFNDPRTLPSNISVNQWLAYDASSGDPVDVWLNRLNFKPIEVTDYKKGAATDWYNLIFHNAVQQNYTLSLSGATDKFNYYWSGGYLNNEGVVVGDKYSTIQSRLKIEGKVTDFLTVGVNTAFADRDESSVPVNWNLITFDSPYGGMWNDDSTDYRYSPQDDAGSSARNPLYGPEYTNRRKNYYTLNSIIYAKVSLPFGITYTANFTPEFEWYQYLNHYSAKDQDYTKLGGTAERDEHQIYQWQLDNIVSWKRTFNARHHFEVTLLANSEKYQYWENDMQTNGFDPSDVLGYHNFQAGSSPAITTDDEYSTAAALMARVFYSYNDRYLLTLSVRRDGSSAFGQKYPWATFPAIAGAWVFTQEPFFKIRWLDFGKLRLSYGVNGNNDIGRYSALSDLTTGKYLEVNSDGTVNVVSELWVNRMQNKNLKWERTGSFDLGLDFSILHDALSGTVETYKSKTTHLLVDRALPDVTGFTDIETNLGEVDNKGLELTLNSHNITRRNFSWRSSFNFSLNRNKIVHLYGNYTNIIDSTGKVTGREEQSDITNGWFIGHAIDAVWDAKVAGVYQTNEADEAEKYGKSPGDFKVEDVNQDGKITNADRKFLGYTQPRFRWTLTNNFTFYRNFDLSFMIYSYWGQMAKFDQAMNGNPLADRVNAYVLPYWTPDRPENKYARLASGNGGATYHVYKKTSFVRLENVSLAYTFPQDLLHKASMRDLKVYFSVRNVAFYAPDWNFWDPENSGPTPRTYTLGFNLTL
jgi:TonB-linked SusC/RagA family outer membrane protein